MTALAHAASRLLRGTGRLRDGAADSRTAARIRRLVQAVGAALAGFAPLCAAQVVLDGTLGPGGALSGPHYVVGADLGRQLGGNLFHSFSAFSIAQGQSATFTGPVSVQNILARVTGGSASSIDGRLRSEIPAANFYLLNPAGVIFGPNASLEVGGSFHVSTADYLRLGTDGRFAATNPASSVLSMAPPAAFGFLSSTPARIELNGSRLTTTPSASLSVIGGDIVARAHGPNASDGTRLDARGGTISLVSVAAPGEIAPERADLDAGAYAALGTVDLKPGTALDVAASGDAGRIVVRGGRVDITGTELAAWSFGSGRGGAIDIAARDTLSIGGGNDAGAAFPTRLLTLTQGPLDGAGIHLSADTLRIGAGVTVQSTTVGAGAGGDIRLAAREIALDGGALISSDTHAGGRAGDIEIAAIGALGIAAQSRIQNVSSGNGDAGRIGLQAEQIALRGGSRVRSQALATGNAGGIEAVADTISLEDGSQIVAHTQGAGAGASIVLSARTISLGGGSWLGADTAGPGRGGDIAIAAHEKLSIDGSRVTATRHATGEGGGIAIDAGAVALDRGAQMSAIALPGSAASGGDIEIVAGSVRLAAGSSVSSGSDAAPGAGRISIRAPEIVIVSGAAAQVRTGGDGRGGVLVIETGRLTLESGGWLGSESGRSGTGGAQPSARGDGGSISIHASESVIASGAGSGIASVAHGEGSAGAVNVVAPTLTFADSAAIASHAGGSGNAGALVLEIGRLELTGAAIQHSLGPGASMPPPGGGAPAIAIKAAHAVVLAGNARIASHTATATAGAGIEIGADALELHDDARISTHSIGTGASGSIAIVVRLLAIGNGAGEPAITTGASAAGRAGSIDIAAAGTVTLAGARVQSATSGGGDGGDIRIATPVLLLSGAAAIEAVTLAQGRAGTIAIESGRLDLAAGTRIASVSGALAGPGGTLQVGTGAAGDVVVEAAESVRIAGAGSGIPTGLFSDTLGTGAGGDVSVKTPYLELHDGARISARTTTAHTGGRTRVEAETIELTGASAITGTTVLTLITQSPQGTVVIDALDNAMLAGASGAAGTQSVATAQAGTISLYAAEVMIDGATPDPTLFPISPDGSILLSAGGAIVVIHGGMPTPSTALAGGASTLPATLAPLALPGGGVNLPAPAPTAADVIALALDGLTPAPSAPPPPPPSGAGGAQPEAPAGATGGGVHGMPVEAPPPESSDAVAVSISPDTGGPLLPPWAPQRYATDSSGAAGGTFLGSAPPLLTEACATRGMPRAHSSFVVSGQGGLPRAPGGGLVATFLDLDRGDFAAAAQPASRAMLALRCGRS